MKKVHFLYGAVCAGLTLGIFAVGSHGSPTQQRLQAKAKIEAPEFKEGGDGEKSEYEQSLDYFYAERTFPGKTLDWDMYKRAMQAPHLESDFDGFGAKPLPGGGHIFPPASMWKFLGPNNLQSPGTKQYQGPPPLAGRINCAAFGPGSTIFAGSATGGFYKGTYGSGDWTEVSDPTWPTYAISSCAADPTHNTVMVGTGDFEGIRPNPPGPMGIMVSYDNGSKGSWVQAGGNFGNAMVSRIAIDPDRQQAIATTGRSSMGGIDAVPLGNNSSYTTLGNLFISRDNGETWAPVPGTPNAVWSSCAISQRSLTTGLRYYYAVCWIPPAGGVAGRAQCWRSDDEGVTFRQTANPFTNSTQYSIDIACSPTYSDNVYIISGGFRSGATMLGDAWIKQSTDGGNNWTNITNAGGGANAFPGDNGVGGVNYDWSQWYYDYSLAVSSKPSPTGPQDWVFVGMIDVASAVPNGAATAWTWQGHSYDVPANVKTHNDDHAIVFNPNDLNQGLLGNDGGCYGMALAGNTANFSPFNKSLWVSEFYNMAFLPDEKAGKQSYYLGGCQDIAEPFLSAGAAGPASNWMNAPYLGDGGYAAIDPTTPATQVFAGYFVPTNLRVFCQSTTNNWTGSTSIDLITPAGERGSFIPPMLRSTSTGNLYIGTNHLWRRSAGAWTNFSGAVQPIKFGSATDYIRSIALSSDFKTLYTGSLEGAVWIDAPNGTVAGAWTEIDRGGWFGTSLPPRTVTSIAVDPNNSNRVWVTLSGPPGVARVWRCDDTSASLLRTWVPITIKVGAAPAIDVPANCIFVVPGGRLSPYTLYVGTDIGVYYSNTAGVSWMDGTVPAGLPQVSVRSINWQNVSGNSYLSIATYGRGAWEVYTSPFTPGGGP